MDSIEKGIWGVKGWPNAIHNSKGFGGGERMAKDRVVTLRKTLMSQKWSN
jgi:hypothetical protein